MSSSDRKRYLTSNVLDQAFLDHCADNLENKLELIIDIETPLAAPDNFIHVSDRPKYVDSVFYDNRVTFPVINRTVGEWLSNELEFGALQIPLNNADGIYNNFLPGGADYGGFIGKQVIVKLGLRDVGSTYKTIFQGAISEVGGFARDIRSILITARDNFEKLNVSFPVGVFSATTFPDIGDSVAGNIVPVIYGDWTVSGNPKTENASVPAFVVNEQDPDVNGDISNTNPVELYISQNDNRFFDTSSVWLKRGDSYHKLAAADITGVIGNRRFLIQQDTGNSLITTDSEPPETKNFLYETGDEFFVKVKGADVLAGAGYEDNCIEICEEILSNYAGVVIVNDLDTTWTYFKEKVTAPGAIKNIKFRVWIQEPQSVIQYVQSLLNQVRLEAFVNRDLKLSLISQHFDEFVSDPVNQFRIRNHDVVESTMRPSIDERNNFNRVQGVLNYLPDIKDESQRTPIFKNQAAIDDANRAISREISFPNMYEIADVNDQVKEVLKIASSSFEIIRCELTWRAMLLDIGDFVNLDVKIGSTLFENVPCLIREIGYDPEGIKIPIRLWSFQLIPFSGYAGVAGAVGGSTAIIEEE